MGCICEFATYVNSVWGKNLKGYLDEIYPLTSVLCIFLPKKPMHNSVAPWHGKICTEVQLDDTV